MKNTFDMNRHEKHELLMYFPAGIFLKCSFWQMELPSREWSAETFQIGVSMVEQGQGIDALDERSDLELQDELALLEANMFEWVFVSLVPELVYLTDN